MSNYIDFTKNKVCFHIAKDQKKGNNIKEVNELAEKTS